MLGIELYSLVCFHHIRETSYIAGCILYKYFTIYIFVWYPRVEDNSDGGNF
jgi:hypothetical protein